MSSVQICAENLPLANCLVCLSLCIAQASSDGRTEQCAYFREGLLQGYELALQDPAWVQLSEVWQVGWMHQAVLCSMPYKQAL